MADSALPPVPGLNLPPMEDSDLNLHPPCEPSSSSSPPPLPQAESQSLTVTLDRWNERVRFPIRAGGAFCSVVKRSDESETNGESSTGEKSLEEYVREWRDKRTENGVAEVARLLPFLTNEPKLVDCRLCYRAIYPGEEIRCTVSGCQSVFHLNCAEKSFNLSKEKIFPKDDNLKRSKAGVKVEGLQFKCPQHVCFVCKQVGHWRCVRCVIASHTKCAPWSEHVIIPPGQHARAVCYKHPSNWLLQNQHADVTESIEEMFNRLPVPYFEEDFNFGVGTSSDDVAEKNNEPAPFVRIRRNIYLVKRKRESHAGVGCTGCTSDSTCKDDCECRGLSVSCSKACHCSDFCTNKPFRKEKKIKIVKTEHCGWGVIALEPLEKGDFIIEYIGEVIDDITCEKRLWDIKKRGDFNFYMCEISKDFTIDATFKGNTSRFLNHSCDPNCKLEKWQVDGETRVGVFASMSIKAGEPLTYDYRFVHFGPMVVCKCGASNCQGFLGSKKIVQQEPISTIKESIREEFLPAREDKLFEWGQKTKRSEMPKIRARIPSNDYQTQFDALFDDPQTQLDASNDPQTQLDASNDPQNQFDALTDSQNQFDESPSIPDRPLCWGRKIKRSYTVSVDEKGH